jgi:hypothetical protein
MPYTKEKTGCWLGVSKNLGDALIYEILTDDKGTVQSWNVIRSATERLKANLGVGFNHNLDPAIRLNDKNQNVIIPLETSLTHTKVKNMHKHWYNIKPKAKKSVPIVLQQQQSGSIPVDVVVPDLAVTLPMIIHIHIHIHIYLFIHKSLPFDDKQWGQERTKKSLHNVFTYSWIHCSFVIISC